MVNGAGHAAACVRLRPFGPRQFAPRADVAALILVYLGTVAVRYETLDPKDQFSARLFTDGMSGEPFAAY